MCYRTYHENANAIGAWKAVYANNTGDNYKQVIPDGQICSAGGQGETNYRPLDRPGPWKMTDIGSNFTVDLYDGGPARRRLARGLRHQAGLQPRVRAHRVGRPRTGEEDRPLPLPGALRHRRQHLRLQRTARRGDRLEGVPHGPEVLPVQRRQLQVTPAGHS
ncbi:lytic polysaccharide monooxygenase [Streptomyces thinghirensis]|nr:lytic polysaccharide monooxygenase [Streptomyces thinghirensis]